MGERLVNSYPGPALSDFSTSERGSSSEVQSPLTNLSPVIKVVSGGCNLRCPYCFYAGYQPEVKVMELETAGVVMDRLMGASPKFITFIWHGGEPTIAGVDFYRDVVSLQEKLKRPGQRVNNQMQTNATLIDADWANFFAENDWHVGVSMDGPESLHNLTRVDAGGKGTFSKVTRGLEMLRERGLRVGAIAVVNRQTVNHPDKIFNFMHGLGLSFSANPCSARLSDPPEVRNLAITDREYTDFLLKLFDLWVGKDDPTFRINPLEDITKAILGGRPSLCKLRGECQRYVTIDYNGDVYPCDEFLEEKYLLGNLVGQEVSEVVSSEEFKSYYRGRLQILETCSDCQWYNMCKGGCMREWHGEKSISEPHLEKFCSARQQLFEGIRSRLVQIREN